MSIGCLGILLGAISGAGAIRDNGRMLGALDDLLTELEHDFSSLEVHVRSGPSVHNASRSKGKKDVEEIKKVEGPNVDDASDFDFGELQREVEEGDVDMRQAAAGSPVWRDLMQSDPARGIHLFQKLMGEKHLVVKRASAYSPAWVPFLEKNLSKGTELFQELIESNDSDVRLASAASPAWVPLLENNTSKGTELFHQLIKDQVWDVKKATAASPAWVPLLEKNPSKGTELLEELVGFSFETSDTGLQVASMRSPAWVLVLEKNPSKGPELFDRLMGYEGKGDERGRMPIERAKSCAIAASPAWVPLLEKYPSEGAELFQGLIESKDDRDYGYSHHGGEEVDHCDLIKAIAASPAWVPLLEKYPSKGTEWLQKLVGDRDRDVKTAIAASPAWVPLLKNNTSKGTELLQKLVGDPDGNVKTAIAASPVWVLLLEKDPSKGTELLQKLVGDPYDAGVRAASARSVAWVPLLEKNLSKGIELFHQLIGDSNKNVKMATAASPAWVPLLEKFPSKGTEWLQKLLGDRDRDVKTAIAASPAWVPLLENNTSKGTELFHQLIEDLDGNVRTAIAASPAWVPLLEKDPSKGIKLFQEVIADGRNSVIKALAASPAWVLLLKADRSKWIQSLHHLESPAWAKTVCKTMTERQNTSISMKYYFRNFQTVELLEAAQLLPEAGAACLAKLGFTFALTERVRESGDSSFLSKLLEQKMWAKLAGKRLVVLADQQKNEAEAAAEKVRKEKKKVEEQRERAQKAEKEAEKKRQLAEKEKKSAQESKKIAEEQKKIAEAAAEKIREEKRKVEEAEKEAEKKRQLAEKEKKSAQESKKIAEEQKKKAEAAAEEIREEKNKVEKQRARAQKAEKEARKKRQLAVQESKSAQEAKKYAEEQKKKAESQREIAVLLVIALLALGTLAVFSGIAWYFYPAICQWRDEKALAAEAKTAIREAETYTLNVSTTPEPPSHLDIFHLHLRVYANPYILHKYDLLEPVLRQAFRISQEVLAKGLRDWDFTAVRAVQSANLGQNLAAEAYGMARKHVDEHDLHSLQALTQLCQQFRQRCDQYSSQLEEVGDSVEKSFKMYLQVFKAKRDYFDPLILRIADTTGAEAQLCGEKGLLRLAEKNALRPSAGLIWDPIRAMLVGHSINELIEVLNCLRAEAELGKIKLLQVNNRFERPTSDNWQDVAIYIQFTDEHFNDIVAEIQMVHQAFLAVRTKFKAHDAYDNFRFAAEALRVKEQVEIPGLPDSQRSAAQR